MIGSVLHLAPQVPVSVSTIKVKVLAGYDSDPSGGTSVTYDPPAGSHPEPPVTSAVAFRNPLPRKPCPCLEVARLPFDETPGAAANKQQQL